MIAEPMNHLPDAALRLPFDQYGRYRMIQEVIDAARPGIAERLRILDVGGYHRLVRGVERRWSMRSFGSGSTRRIWFSRSANTYEYLSRDFQRRNRNRYRRRF